MFKKNNPNTTPTTTNTPNGINKKANNNAKSGNKMYDPSTAAKKYEGQNGLYDPLTVGKKFVSKTAEKLGSILEEAGLVNEEMIRKVVVNPNESAQTLKRSLISQGFVREEDILDALAREMGMEKIHLGEVNVTPDLLNQIDAKIAKTYRVFPVAYDNETIQIALADPLNINITDDLEKILGKKVIGLVASDAEIDKAIKRYYEGSEVTELYESFTDQLDGENDDEKDLYDEIDLSTSEIDQPPVVKFVDLIFKQAVHDRASDIHVEPSKLSVTIRFRIDGVLHEIPSPPKKWQNAILSRLKVLAGIDLAEKRIPQDGRIKLNMGDKKLDLRVSSLPSIFGESIVMRILDQSSVLMGLQEVGFLPDTIRLFEELIRSPNGVILMTGPTGSGKTTTLYSALSTINTPEKKIITIENPVEYMLDGINQVQVNEDIGLDFAMGLRTMLRQSPDVIMVGEIRDLATAEIAVRAALTGHLVFSTLHTNDAPSSTIRLIDMGIKPFLVASSIQAVIAQRLVRRICSHCKMEYTPHPEEIIEMGYDPNQYLGQAFYKGAGCDRCNHSGYRGRTAIHEAMVSTPEIRQMVIRCEASSKIKKLAIKQGMRTLRMDGWEKILLGLTTIEDIMRITQSDEA